MKKSAASLATMALAMAAMSEPTMPITNPRIGFGGTTFVSGRIGFVIPQNIPNQRQRRRNERRNPSLRNKRK